MAHNMPVRTLAWARSVVVTYDTHTPRLSVDRLWVSDKDMNRDFIISTCPSTRTPIYPVIRAQDKMHMAVVAKLMVVDATTTPQAAEQAGSQSARQGVVGVDAGPSSSAAEPTDLWKTDATVIVETDRLWRKKLNTDLEYTAEEERALVRDVADRETEEQLMQDNAEKLNDIWEKMARTYVRQVHFNRMFEARSQFRRVDKKNEALAEEKLQEAARHTAEYAKQLKLSECEYKRRRLNHQKTEVERAIEVERAMKRERKDGGDDFDSVRAGWQERVRLQAELQEEEEGRTQKRRRDGGGDVRGDFNETICQTMFEGDELLRVIAEQVLASDPSAARSSGGPCSSAGPPPPRGLLLENRDPPLVVPPAETDNEEEDPPPVVPQQQEAATDDEEEDPPPVVHDEEEEEMPMAIDGITRC